MPGRRGDDIRRMEQHYHWPVVHREGLPDLSSGEAAYYQGVQEFNAQSRNVKVVFINQFGFDASLRQAHAGRHGIHGHPQGLGRGIRPEHLRAVRHRAGRADQLRRDLRLQRMLRLRGFRCTKRPADKPTPNVIVADYTDLPQKALRPEQLMSHRPAAAG